MHHETNRDLLVSIPFCKNFGDDMRDGLALCLIFNWLCPDICSEDIFLDDDSELRRDVVSQSSLTFQRAFILLLRHGAARL